MPRAVSTAARALGYPDSVGVKPRLAWNAHAAARPAQACA